MANLADLSEVLLELGLSESCTDVERAIAGTALQRAEGAVKHFLRYDPFMQERTEFYPQGVSATRQAVDGVWEANDTEAFLRQSVGASSDELQIQHVPIRSISALYIDYDGRSGTRSGSFGAGTLKVEGVDFWPNYDALDSSGAKICRDGIIRSIGRWSMEPGSVKIVYTAGYSAAELHGQDSVIDASPINEAVVLEATRRAKRAFLLAKKSRVGFVAGPFTNESLGDYSYSIDSSLITRMYGSNLLSDDAKIMLTDFQNYGWSLSS